MSLKFISHMLSHKIYYEKNTYYLEKLVILM